MESDLRSFISSLEWNQELIHVEGANLEVEVGIISELMYEHEGPALLFDGIPECPKGYRILANPFSTLKRALLGLGWPVDLDAGMAMDKFADLAKNMKPISPKEVTDGPVLEEVIKGEDVDLTKLAAARWHEPDGGRYLGTGDIVLMRDPETDYVNLGTYRVMVHDRTTAGLYIDPDQHGDLIRKKYWDEGKSCPVAVALGPEPSLIIASSGYFGNPWGVSEYGLAGYLKGSPIQVIVDDQTGLPIPAHTETVLIGESFPEYRPEGPFGEFYGYYSEGSQQAPIIRINTIYTRQDPIILGCPPQRPRGSINYFFGFPGRSATLLDRLRKTGLPGIIDVWPLSSPGMTVVKVNQQYFGHKEKVARLASSQEMWGRFIITVDEDINIRDSREVLWAISTRCDPKSDIEILPNCPTSPIDPILSPQAKKEGKATISRVIMDACRPYDRKEDFPLGIRSSDKTRTEIFRKWHELFDQKTWSEGRLAKVHKNVP